MVSLVDLMHSKSSDPFDERQARHLPFNEEAFSTSDVPIPGLVIGGPSR
jgi:hypothetical protein